MNKVFALLFLITLVNHLPAQHTGNNLSEKSIQLSTGVTLKYVEQGNTNGVPVIFLHGYSDSWRSFQSTLPFLPESVHAFAITQRGHGNSSKPKGAYHPKDFAADVAAFIKSKNLEAAYIVGHSMGGMITQQFALSYPQLTRGIILESTDATFQDNPGFPEFNKEIQKLKDPVSYHFVNEFQKGACAQPIDSVYYSLMVNESLKLPAYVWKETSTGFMSVDYRNDLDKITQPALILWGDKDILCLQKDQDILTRGIRDAEMVVYKETGHALHWEQPERFANDIVSFISKTTIVSNGPDSDLYFLNHGN